MKREREHCVCVKVHGDPSLCQHSLPVVPGPHWYTMVHAQTIVTPAERTTALTRTRHANILKHNFLYRNKIMSHAEKLLQKY